jgi:hypothetical protein
MPHAAHTHRTVLAAANAVARAATPKRKLAVRDEFGPDRGRPFTLTAAAPVRRGPDVDDLGRRVSRRSTTAYEVAC